jgi:hypothetical protein
VLTSSCCVITAADPLADLAYDTYFIGHTRWFAGPDGTAFLDHLRRRPH